MSRFGGHGGKRRRGNRRRVLKDDKRVLVFWFTGMWRKTSVRFNGIVIFR
jgi:hypothetical protein